MSNVKNKRAAMKGMLNRVVAKAAVAPPAPKKDVPRVRTTWDASGHILWPTEKKAAEPAVKGLRELLEVRAPGEYHVGMPCGRCNGGRYFHHVKREWMKCYRCDGDGVISARDIAFYERRKATGAPLCDIYGGL